ncbi:SDR family NAD(P)-dependent oxidoreductase [Cupriavidus basilensis]|uniref:SDR family NAD(P)-dependent oxidoreductase n=1 Tax=Cupriavidus basilensis TaxID=68895 RepID=UPI0020A6C93F|nr:SDR family oxidoreductase [Cupriavidus basilensis]MCP3024078.1 SDR family oxidoreductase [Cupriavidus basilensis]
MDGFTLLPPPGTRVAVVGGCGGIGRAVVARAVEIGLRVVVLDLPRSMALFPPPEGALAVACDAMDEASMGAAFDTVAREFDGLDAVINLVGFTKERMRLSDLPLAEWDEITRGTLTSAFLVSRAALPLLRAAGGGSMVHTASTFGVAVSLPGYGPYAASKAGVMNLVRALATECGPEIRVNAVAPGLVQTAFLQGGTGRPEKNERIDADAVTRMLPMRRIAQPADMVGTYLFLIGPGSVYITSQTIHVNGGLWS